MRSTFGAKWACFAVGLAFVGGCSSSSDSGTPSGGDTGTTVDSSTSDSGGGSDTASTDSGSGADTTDTAPAKCDPKTSAGCVACGTDSCGSGKECCGSGSSRACAAGCEAGVAEACDGPEDCASSGGQCCVDADVKFSGGTTATATCGSSCDTENASTGSGDIVKSHSCRTGADCADVADSFGVPYGNCCHPKDLDVAVCVSDTYADQLKTSAGATCN